MFNWFKTKESFKNQLEGLDVTELPETKIEEPEPTGQTMYSIGLTDNNRVSFRMYHSEITMNSQGVQNIIDQLEVFKRQIEQNAVDTDEEVQ